MHVLVFKLTSTLIYTEGNMLYLEIPIGVGFSYSKDSSSYEMLVIKYMVSVCEVLFSNNSCLDMEQAFVLSSSTFNEYSSELLKLLFIIF